MKKSPPQNKMQILELKLLDFLQKERISIEEFIVLTEVIKWRAFDSNAKMVEKKQHSQSKPDTSMFR